MIDILDRFSVFNDFEFDEETHIYTYKGQKIKTSSTALISQYSQPFDKENMAARCAKKKGITKEEMIAEWDLNNLISQNKGTYLHAYMENSTANKKYCYPKDNILKNIGRDFFAEGDMWVKITSMMNKFQNDIRGHMIPIRSELVIGNPDYNLAGTADQIYYNKASQNLEIWDWKTNKKIEFEGYKDFRTQQTQKMIYPLGHLDDCNFVHYSLQLSMYKDILQTMTGLTFGNNYIVWFNENNDTYQVYQCLDLSVEAHQILVKNGCPF